LLLILFNPVLSCRAVRPARPALIGVSRSCDGASRHSGDAARIDAAFPDGEPVNQANVRCAEPQYRPWRLGATLFSLIGLLARVVAGAGV